MTLQRMVRKQSDNTYLHRDFHAALNHGMDYLWTHYGEESVRQWLRDYVHHWHRPLRQELAAGNLHALRVYVEALYAVEGAPADIEESQCSLTVRVGRCPAVAFLRERGEAVHPLFVETTRTVNEAICEGTPFQAELLDYDPLTGAGIQRFTRRRS